MYSKYRHSVKVIFNFLLNNALFSEHNLAIDERNEIFRPPENNLENPGHLFLQYFNSFFSDFQMTNVRNKISLETDL